jgi:hypothetical protein
LWPVAVDSRAEFIAPGYRKSQTRFVFPPHEEVGDVGFEKRVAFGAEAELFVESAEMSLAVELEFIEAAFAGHGEREFQEAVAVSLPSPCLADSEAFELGAIAEEVDTRRGDGFTVDFSENLQGFGIQPIDFLGAGNVLFFHENDGAHEKAPQKFAGSFGETELNGRWHGGIQEK